MPMQIHQRFLFSFFARQQCAGFAPPPVFICPSLCLGVNALTEVELEKEQV